MLQSAPARRTRADGNRRSIGADGPGGRTAGHGTGPLGVLTQVPKLGSLQRWVRDCDAAGDDPRALEVSAASVRARPPGALVPAAIGGPSALMGTAVAPLVTALGRS